MVAIGDPATEPFPGGNFHWVSVVGLSVFEP